jgi:hypothetical protein
MDSQPQDEPGYLHDAFLEATEQKKSERELLLKSFVERIEGNVGTVISLVDSESGRQKSDDSGRNSNVRNKKQLSNRWRDMMRREKKRHRRRNGPPNKPRHKMSVEELWDEVLSDADLPFSDPSQLLSQHPLPIPNEIPVDDNESDETFDLVSPIFGLHIDEEDHLKDIDSLDDDANDGSLTSFIESSAENADHESKSQSNEEPKVRDAYNVESERNNDFHVDAILTATALLSATTAEEWALFASRSRRTDNEDNDRELALEALDGEIELSRYEVDDLHGASEDGSKTGHLGIDDIHELLGDLRSKKYVLTTTESNLLLARLVTAIDTPVEVMLDEALQLYREMKLLATIGREESGPDAATYRILILALSRRLMALGEAVSLCQDMMESPVDLTTEVFLDGMQACFSRNDLGAALEMMNLARNDHHKPFRPPVLAYILVLEMMKHENLREDALDLFKRFEEVRKNCSLLIESSSSDVLINDLTSNTKSQMTSEAKIRTNCF